MQKELGAGGNAAVFTATSKFGDQYAVKMLEVGITLDHLPADSPLNDPAILPEVLKALLGSGPQPAVRETLHHLSCSDQVTSGVIPAFGVFTTKRTGGDWWVRWKRDNAESLCSGKQLAALRAATPTVHYLCLVQQLGVTTLEQVLERLLQQQPPPSVSTSCQPMLLVACGICAAP